MGWVERILDFGVALLDAPVVIVSFFGIVILISLGRVPQELEPLFYAGLGALALAIIFATFATRDRRRNSR